MTQGHSWHTKRVFVSSTFEDMGRERDLLVRQVFPRLRSAGEECATHVVGVDLRWGIPAGDDREGGLVARQCLDAVDACRPFLLGFIGSRRGWVPSLDDFGDDPSEPSAALRRAVELGLSLTELEILHALCPFEDSQPPSSVLLYIAEGALGGSSRLVTALREYGIDLDGDVPENLRVREYDKAVALEAGASLPDRLVEELGVLLDLAVDGNASIPAASEYHERVRALALIGAVAQPAAIEAVTAEIAAGSKLVIVEGPSGAGKTTLLAQLATTLRRPGGRGAVARYLGSAAPPDNEDSLVSSLSAELEELVGHEPSLTGSRDLFRRWAEVWEASEAQHPPVLILDGLDAAPIQPHALHWLVEPLRHGATVVISLDPESTAGGALKQSLEGVRGTVVQRLEGLQDVSTREAFVREQLTVHLKTLDREMMETVVRQPAAADPLYMAVVLAELRLHGRHDDLADQAQSRFAGGREEAIHALLDRLELETDTRVLGVVLGALAHSPSGLSTAQLARLAWPGEGSSADREGEIEAILHQLEAFLQRRPYAHSVSTAAFRTVLEDRYSSHAPPHGPAVAPGAGPRAWDAALAGLLRHPPEDPGTPRGSAATLRRFRDLAHHLLRADKLDELAEYLLDLGSAVERLRLVGPGGLGRELELCSESIPDSATRARVADLRSLLAGSADQLYALGRSRTPHANEVVQLLAIQAAIMDLADLESALAERLDEAPRRARSLWIEGRGARTAMIRANPVWCEDLAVAPNGRWLLFGDGTDATLYNTDTLREHRRFGEPELGPVARACFSPDGALLALASDGELTIVHTATGTVRDRWAVGGTPSHDLRWLDDVIVAALREEVIAVDPSTGMTVRVPCPGATALAPLADQATLLVGTADGDLVRLALPIDHDAARERIGGVDDPIDALVAGNAGTMAWALAGRRRLVEWDLETGEASLPFREFRPLNAILLDEPNGALVAATGVGELAVHDLQTRERWTVKSVQHSAVAAAMDQAGRVWVAGQPGVDITELVSVRLDGETGLDDAVHGVALSPDGRLAVDARSWGRVWIRDARTKLDYFDLEPEGRIQRTYCCRFNSNGDVLMVGYLDRLLIVDPRRHEVLAQLGAMGAWEQVPFDGVRAIGIAPDDAFFVAGDSQGHLAAFNWTYEAFAVAELDAPPSGIEVLPEHRVLVLDERGAITLRDAGLAIVESYPNVGDRSYALAVAPRRRDFFTSHRGGVVARWSIDSPGPPRSFSAEIGEVEALHVVDGERMLVAAGRDGIVRFWDVDAGTVLLDLPFPGAVDNLFVAEDASAALLSLAQSTVVSLALEGLASDHPEDQ